jgi:hypothetical protein
LPGLEPDPPPAGGEEKGAAVRHQVRALRTMPISLLHGAWAGHRPVGSSTWSFHRVRA